MNTLQALTPSKKPQKPVVTDNPFEALKDVGETVVGSVKTASADAMKDMWAQILGVDNYAKAPSSKQSGDLKPGQAINLKDMAKAKEKKSVQEAPLSYIKEIREAGNAGVQKESAEIRQQIQSILYELQRLAQSSAVIQKEVSSAIGQGIINPGVYHVNFFEWMLTVVRDARKRVENAGTWMHTVKKKKGLFIIGMKKNMSQFLSGERSVSNQTA